MTLRLRLGSKGVDYRYTRKRREARITVPIPAAQIPLRLLPVGDELLLSVASAPAPEKVAHEPPPLVEEDGEEEDSGDSAEGDDGNADDLPLLGTPPIAVG